MLKPIKFKNIHNKNLSKKFKKEIKFNEMATIS